MTTPLFRLEPSWQDRMISAGRSVYYALAEPYKLAKARQQSESYCALKMPLVDICIPTFNRADLLFERAIPSVLSQHYRNWRLYIMAHGCTDDTIDRVARLAGTDKRVRLISVPRERTYPPSPENHWLVGPVAPLNTFLEHAKYSSAVWLARMDDDDEWYPDHLMRALDFANKGNWEFVSAGAIVNKVPVRPYQYPGGFPATAHYGVPGLVGGCATWLYRRYLHVFRYNPDCWRKEWNRNNDTDLPQRMFAAGVRMGYDPYIACLTRPRTADGLTGSQAYFAQPYEIAKRYRFDCARER